MKFSLVLATVDRIDEVARFLGSLEKQTHRDFELIVVDQNPEGTLAPILDVHKDNFPIVHMARPDDRGVSKSRNAGIQRATGELLTFPDDDCWYPPELLETVANFMKNRPDVDTVSGRMAHGHTEPKVESGKRAEDGYFLASRLKVAQVPGPWGLFLRGPRAQKAGIFDETLGPGAGTPWGSGEDTDYYLQVYEAGFNFFYNPAVIVYHPIVTQYYADGSDLQRSYRYGAGRTRVWKRHGLPFWYFAYEVSRSGAGFVLSLLQGRVPKAIWHWGAFRGKIRGWYSV